MSATSQRTRVLLAVAAGFSLGGAAYVLYRRSKSRQQRKAPSAKSARLLLPTAVKPVHYQLLLQPDLEAFTFSGTVSIVVEVKAKTNVVVVRQLAAPHPACGVLSRVRCVPRPSRPHCAGPQQRAGSDARRRYRPRWAPGGAFEQSQLPSRGGAACAVQLW